MKEASFSRQFTAIFSSTKPQIHSLEDMEESGWPVSELEDELLAQARQQFTERAPIH